MRLSPVRYIFSAALVVAMWSCSSSEDDTPVYDDILSHTRWTQIYTDNTNVIISERFGIPEYIRSMLEVVELPAVERTDTIWNLDVSGKYVLTFANDDCKLQDIHYSKGTYQLHTFIRRETYYPDQSHSWTDPSGNRLFEVVMKNDTLTYSETYIGEGMNEILSSGKAYVEHTYDDTTLSRSASFPYSDEKSDTYRMTFTRNGRNIVLSGDKHLIGVINEDGDKIEFSEIGTLYLE